MLEKENDKLEFFKKLTKFFSAMLFCVKSIFVGSENSKKLWMKKIKGKNDIDINIINIFFDLYLSKKLKLLIILINKKIIKIGIITKNSGFVIWIKDKLMNINANDIKLNLIVLFCVK